MKWMLYMSTGTVKALFHGNQASEPIQLDSCISLDSALDRFPSVLCFGFFAKSDEPKALFHQPGLMGPTCDAPTHRGKINSIHGMS